MENGIKSMQELFDKVAAMNGDYYDLRGVSSLLFLPALGLALPGKALCGLFQSLNCLNVLPHITHFQIISLFLGVLNWNGGERPVSECADIGLVCNALGPKKP